MVRILVAFVLGAMAVQAQQPSVARDAQTANQQRVKEQAIIIPQGTTVEVRLLSGQKLRGRLGLVSDQGIALRGVFENKIEERTINFTDIRSVRYYNPLLPRMTVHYIILAASMAANIALAATR